MSRKAVDVVLLPDERMTGIAIEANAGLVGKFGEKIVLSKEKCLPHISLAMGGIDEKGLDAVEQVLRRIAEQYSLGGLRVVGIGVSVGSGGEKVSVFELEKSKAIQSLHKEVMDGLEPYFNCDVSEGMVADAEVAASTLRWIRQYREKSSFENFWPHITIGYGEMEKISLPIEFDASALALCHLGNHCTCKKVLVSVKLE